ncbi:hypothetical protein SCALM49S_10024 [Streptomyces californicus]
MTRPLARARRRCRPPLEDWLRERYFQAKTDISSSGVHNYTSGNSAPSTPRCSVRGA